jgi:VIT1/CCC1 family predicted Fe2+/Mn2+ transporter
LLESLESTSVPLSVPFGGGTLEVGGSSPSARSLLERNPDLEFEELTTIYESRGLDRSVALEVAEQLTRHDALSAHTRDELGLSDVHLARPIQAAVASGLAFAAGAVLPLGVAIAAPLSSLSTFVTAASLASLMVLGGVAARAGGAAILRGSTRVTLWGAVAMTLTALVGRAFGAVL